MKSRDTDEDEDESDDDEKVETLKQVNNKETKWQHNAIVGSTEKIKWIKYQIDVFLIFSTSILQSIRQANKMLRFKAIYAKRKPAEYSEYTRI